MKLSILQGQKRREKEVRRREGDELRRNIERKEERKYREEERQEERLRPDHESKMQQRMLKTIAIIMSQSFTHNHTTSDGSFD